MTIEQKISAKEVRLLNEFLAEMKRLLDLNTHKGSIVVDGNDCDYPYLHFKIAQHALALCEHAFRVKRNEACYDKSEREITEACIDIANLAFIYRANLGAGKS